MNMFDFDFLIVSAFTNNSPITTNLRKHDQLTKFLDDGGFDYYVQLGFYQNKPELSVIVFNINLKFSIFLLKSLNQDCVIFGTDHCFFLIDKNGVVFTTTEFDDITSDHSIMFIDKTELKYKFKF